MGSQDPLSRPDEDSITLWYSEALWEELAPESIIDAGLDRAPNSGWKAAGPDELTHEFNAWPKKKRGEGKKDDASGEAGAKI